MSDAASTQYKRALVASLVGTSIEWFDYFLYGTAAALVFGKLYFSTSDPAIALMLSYLTFSLPFFIRPFGGIFFAHMGDKIGRKQTLIVTLTLMGGATFLIGLLPTYAQWGFWAPFCLITLRVIQGLGIGGEWGGAVLVATETSSKKTLGFAGSIPQMGVPIGMLFGTSAMQFISSITTEAEFLAWGWRVPFVASIFLIFLGLWIRNGLEETPAFEETKKSRQDRQVSPGRNPPTSLERGTYGRGPEGGRNGAVLHRQHLRYHLCNEYAQNAAGGCTQRHYLGNDCLHYHDPCHGQSGRPLQPQEDLYLGRLYFHDVRLPVFLVTEYEEPLPYHCC